MNATERETVINTDDGAEHVRIWTAQRTYITRLRKNLQVTEVDTGFIDGTEWAEFTVPSERWNPVSGVKVLRVMTDEQRAAAGERLRKAREK